MQNARTALSEENIHGEAVKTAGKYLCQLRMTAEKSIAENVKTAGEKHSILKRWLVARK
jgi:hypothetical protein